MTPMMAAAMRPGRIVTATAARSGDNHDPSPTIGASAAGNAVTARVARTTTFASFCH